jgi:hypothetical protein
MQVIPAINRYQKCQNGAYQQINRRDFIEVEVEEKRIVLTLIEDKILRFHNVVPMRNPRNEKHNKSAKMNCNRTESYPGDRGFIFFWNYQAKGKSDHRNKFY